MSFKKKPAINNTLLVIDRIPQNNSSLLLLVILYRTKDISSLMIELNVKIVNETKRYLSSKVNKILHEFVIKKKKKKKKIKSLDIYDY